MRHQLRTGFSKFYKQKEKYLILGGGGDYEELFLILINREEIEEEMEQAESDDPALAQIDQSGKKIFSI